MTIPAPVAQVTLDLLPVTGGRIGYQIVGAGKAAGEDGEPGGAKATFLLDLSGVVADDDDLGWVGFDCEVAVNPLGAARDEALTPEGFLGDGWCDVASRSIVFRFNIGPPIAHDLVEFGARLSAGGQLRLQLKCDLVELHPDGEDPTCVSFKVTRLLAFGQDPA